MSIAISDTLVLTVNQQFIAVIAGNHAPDCYGLSLRMMNRSYSLAASPADRPASFVRDDMLITLHHVDLLISKFFY